MPGATRRAPAPRHLERDLLLGGAGSATGLYVSYLALQRVYQTASWLMDAAVPSPPPTIQPVVREFMQYKFPPEWAMLARDTAYPGCALWLTVCGIFYVTSPEFQVLELRNRAPPAKGVASTAVVAPDDGWDDAADPAAAALGAGLNGAYGGAKAVAATAVNPIRWFARTAPPSTAPPPTAPPKPDPAAGAKTKLQQQIAADAAIPVKLPAHAYYLFLSAQTWLPSTDRLPLVLRQLELRMQQYADECLLQMVLSDLHHRAAQRPQTGITPGIQRAARFLMRRILDYTQPATWSERLRRMAHVAAAPARPTASSLWRDFDASFRDFFKSEWAQGGAHLQAAPYFLRASNPAYGSDSLTKLGLKLTVTTLQLELRFEPLYAPPPTPEQAVAAGAPYDVGPACLRGHLVYSVR